MPIHTPVPTLITCVLALALVSGHCSAQDKLAPPHEVVTQPALDRPIAAIPGSPIVDPRVVLRSFLRGVWHSNPAGDTPELIWRAAPIEVRGVPNTALIEISRADSPASPFRLFVLQVLVRQNTLLLRQFELPGASGMKDALAGLTGAPDSLPTLDASALAPSLDMPLTRMGLGFHGATDHPFPTTRDGAIEMTASLDLGLHTIRVADVGFDADGKQVWGQKDGHAIEFVPVQPQPSPTTASDDGLFIVTTLPAPASSPKLEPNGEVLIHYTSWLTTGQLLETSRTPGHEPVKARIPGNLLPGLNKGLVGIAVGERRKIIIPPELAYGDQGRPPIPPKSTLIFDVLCLRIDNSPSPQVPPTMFNPHSAPNPGASPTVPADPNAPIGSPPTNGIPESPRGGH